MSKKIGIFMSTIKAVSAWLHGEGSEQFRLYTWPRIKSFTRRFINLGIYERIEGFYRIVDDTFYQGDLIELEDDTREEIRQAEEMAEMLERDTYPVATSIERSELPRRKDIIKNLFIWQSVEQGRTYRCGTFTFNNMLRTSMLQSGLKPDKIVCAMDPLYKATKHGKGKTGTVIDTAIRIIGERGFPMPSWFPIMDNHHKELQALEDDPNTENAFKFAAYVMTGKFIFTRSYDEAVRLDRELGDNWRMQVSAHFCPSLKYFGEKIPYVTKVDGRYNFTRTGGHSFEGVRHSFSIHDETKEAGFDINDSAYRSHEDGNRFITARLMDLGLVRVRFVEFVDSINRTADPKPEDDVKVELSDEDKTILATTDIRFGDKGRAVQALQRYLISAGYTIPAGVTGNFFEQTRAAFENWQRDNLKVDIAPQHRGKYWLGMSRQRFIELNN